MNHSLQFLKKGGILTLKSWKQNKPDKKSGYTIRNTTPPQLPPSSLMAFEKTMKEKISKWGKIVLLFYKLSASERVTPELNNVKLINHNNQGFSKVTINVWNRNSKTSTNIHTLYSLAFREAAKLSLGIS